MTIPNIVYEILVSSGVLSAIGLALRSALKSAVDQFTKDISSHLTPNGGSSLYDQAKQGKDFAQKALEISVQTEARVKQLETKVDAIILSRVP